MPQTYTDYYPDIYPDIYGQAAAWPGGNHLDVRADVNLGTWQDATPYLRNGTPVTITRGRPNLKSQISPAQALFTVDNRDARWTIRNPAGPWYGQLVQSSPVRFSVPSSVTGINAYLRMETDRTAYASAPDTTALQITSGTLSARIDCKITDFSAQANLLGKWSGTTTSWVMNVNTDGTILLFTFDGSTTWLSQSTLPLPYYGQRIALRADYNIAAQAVTFYTAPTMAGSWTQLGVGVATGATTLSAAAGQPVHVGAVTSKGNVFGEVYEAQIYSTATLVADPVFTSQAPGGTSFTDAQSNTWTLHGTAELSGRSYRFHGELAALPRAAAPNNAGAYASAQAGGVTRRLQQQQSPADSAMYRATIRMPAANRLAAYWPAEDAAGATQIGSATGGRPMGNAGLTMASSSVFAASAALPVMNGGTATAIVDPNSVTWQDNAIRFLLSVPSGGDTSGNGAVVARVYTQGTVARMDLIYGSGSNGTFTLNGYDSTGAQIGGFGGFFGNNLNGTSVRVALQLTNAGGGNIEWLLSTVAPAASLGGVNSGTIAGTIGGVTGVAFGGGLTTSAMGHFTVQGVADDPVGFNQPLNAWSGETAADRFARLCAEEGIACRITGPPARSVPMGNQSIQTITALLQECEDTDQGMMEEPRQILGLGYITSWALCNQPAAVTADYTTAVIDPAFNPSSDDSLIVNDATFTAADGSAGRYVLTTGPTSVNPPPAGAGRFDTSVTVNPASDSQLTSLVTWYVHARSADEDRYPAIGFQMARPNSLPAVAAAGIGRYLQLTNPPAWVPPGPVRQIIAGVTETIGPQPAWMITFNCVPEAPYETAIADDAVYGRVTSNGITVHANTPYGSGTFQFDTTSGPLWTTASGDFPADLNIGGQRITVSACSGSTSPQTFTVSAWGVNGVQKNLTAGQSIEFWYPPYLGI